ncbi:MAG TPA: hypothetical protein VJ487_15685 [Alphaproteobacteria bacterium]|nr:hypothetical protein [Alphaproteobacteria bacterium]
MRNESNIVPISKHVFVGIKTVHPKSFRPRPNSFLTRLIKFNYAFAPYELERLIGLKDVAASYEMFVYGTIGEFSADDAPLKAYADYGSSRPALVMRSQRNPRKAGDGTAWDRLLGQSRWRIYDWQQVYAHESNVGCLYCSQSSSLGFGESRLFFPNAGLYRHNFGLSGHDVSLTDGNFPREAGENQQANGDKEVGYCRKRPYDIGPFYFAGIFIFVPISLFVGGFVIACYGDTLRRWHQCFVIGGFAISIFGCVTLLILIWLDCR